jgi:serine/threonine protein kinase
MFAPQTEIIASVQGHVIYQSTLPPGVYEIGRGATAKTDRAVTGKIRLDAEKVSRHHALLTLNYSDWSIEDVGSVNGTRVGGRLVSGKGAQIFPRQEVQVGDVRLSLRRIEMEETMDSIAPHAAVVLRYLPKELRDERKYRVNGVMAQGGMGVVLEAEDVATRRLVAMKTLIQNSSKEETERFIEEALITAQLEHPNIVPVYEVNVNELSRPFFTMRLVRGQSLKQVLQRLASEGTQAVNEYPLDRLLAVLLKVCGAMGYAHSKGVVHRDLKPENIMLGEFGEVLVIDWGLAKPLNPTITARVAGLNSRAHVSSPLREGPNGLHTIDGVALGTPAFMSPEQAGGNGEMVDTRADIYALGAILYNILTLDLPISGENAEEVLERVASGSITPPQRLVAGRVLRHLPGGRLPEGLAEVALKAMAFDVEERFATAAEMQQAIREAACAIVSYETIWA